MLRITLTINETQIADYEVRNIGFVPGGEHLYTVSRIIDGTTVEEPMFTLTHRRRKNGAHFLATQALLRLSTMAEHPSRQESPVCPYCGMTTWINDHCALPGCEGHKEAVEEELDDENLRTWKDERVSKEGWMGIVQATSHIDTNEIWAEPEDDRAVTRPLNWKPET